MDLKGLKKLRKGVGMLTAIVLYPKKIAALISLGLIFSASPTIARPNFNMTLLSSRSISDIRGCWGYVDPGTQREYALMCAGNRLEIWNVTTPASPVLTRTVTATGGELKQIRPYSHYVFAVNQSGVALQVIDMAQIATNPAAVATVKNFNVPGSSGAHALHIDGNYAYLGMNGSADPWWIVNISDPLNPAATGSYLTSVLTGFRQSHDSYVSGDTAYVAFLGAGFSVVDISNKSAPAKIADVSYPSPILTHNCWITEDHKFLFTTDEVSNGFIRVWDVRNPQSPRQVGSWAAGVAGSDVHNVQVKGNFLYASYYGEGVEVLDIEDPTQPVEVGHYDTDPAFGGFAGCWDFFNFFPSGTLVASNYYGASNPGMFLLNFNGAKAAKIKGVVKNLNNNNPLIGVTVRLLDVGRQTTTDAAGSYRIRSEGGSRTLEFSRTGFKAETVVVSVNYSDSATVNVNLLPLYNGILNGQVIAQDGSPLAGVQVGLLGDEAFQDISDGSGNFSVDPLPTGQPIQVATALWGYKQALGTFTLAPNVPQSTSYQLSLGYTDDFEFNLGWSTSAPDDDASAGFWERVEPIAAFNFSNFQTQAGADRTAGAGRLAFITEQACASCTYDDHDVDGGKVTLTSPVFDLTGFNKPQLSYYRWHNNSGGQNPQQDTFYVAISNDSGQTWTSLEKYRFSGTTWALKQFQLRGMLPFTNEMLVRFVATDRGGVSTVEAGVDDFKIVETLVTGDMNGDGLATPADAVTFLNAVFLGNPAIPVENGDFSGDCLLTAADVILLLNHIFLGDPLTLTCLP